MSKLETALATALPKLEGAKKNSANPHFKSKYADLGSVIEAIRPIAEDGIWFRQSLHESETGVTVETFYIGHGESISAGILYMPADKRNAQGFGSALTYARRYALQTAFGLATEDDDGNEASKGQSQSGAVSPPVTFPDGPATGISQLKNMVRPLWREMSGCADLGEYLGLIEAPENKAIIEQCSQLEGPHRVELWDGDGKDNPGLSGFMAKRKAELEQKENDMQAISGGQYGKDK